MGRITKEVKAMADAHISAKIQGKFDDPIVNTKNELISCLLAGKTFSAVIREIEIRYISITSNLMCSQFGHISDAYKKEVYKAFKKLMAI